MEYLDIIDENDNLIGRETRSLVHKLGLLHRGIHVFLFTSSGKLLVQLRHNNRDTWPLAFDCSVSEHVKSGEGYHDAAMRGLREELGITNLDFQPVLRFKLNYGEADNMISQLFESSVEPAMVRMNISEIESISFYDPSDLLRMIDHDEDIFSSWFKQLLFWYSGKPSELEIIYQFSS